MFSRHKSTPAKIIFSSISSLSVAGPSVNVIFVC
jgi:hypothetical protein